MNCDGDVTFDDTDLFVAKLGCPNAPDCDVPCTWTHGDINGDGVISWDDIDPYLAQVGTAATGCWPTARTSRPPAPRMLRSWVNSDP